VRDACFSAAADRAVPDEARRGAVRETDVVHEFEEQGELEPDRELEGREDCAAPSGVAVVAEPSARAARAALRD